MTQNDFKRETEALRDEIANLGTRHEQVSVLSHIAIVVSTTYVTFYATYLWARLDANGRAWCVVPAVVSVAAFAYLCARRRSLARAYNTLTEYYNDRLRGLR